MRRHLPKLLLVLPLVLLGTAAAHAAGVANPVGNSAWDLYVFGNGFVVYQVLMSIKMLMVPTSGSTGYSTVVTFMAVLGFLVLAVRTGFNPSKNIFSLFGYLLTAWMISYASTGLVANVNIDDLAVTGAGSGGTYSVSGVPAIVALPAALVSEVGNYFTSTMESYFNMPGDFTLSGAAGQFDLFGKMVADSSKFTFTSPALRQSWASYMGNCAVPAIALNRLKGLAYPSNYAPSSGGAAPSPVPVYGVDVLLRSTNLMRDLGSAASPAIMTTYYPIKGSPMIGVPPSASGGTSLGMGVVVTCADAYQNLLVDAKNNAKAALGASAAQWSASGALTPLSTAFNGMLQSAYATGSSYAGYTDPESYVTQQSMLNEMSPALRQSASALGNNSLIQAAALAQGQQNQRSSWETAFGMFNNMMGYVFTVLQVFIFALTPIIAVMLMIPGLGGKVFANYAQILVWLALWMPMLALINFVITLFSMQTFSGDIQLYGGLSAQNSGIMSQSSANLVLAAQFLGTMVPMLAWGVVTGSLAFTEFIAHGIGSSFAMQAGAAAASGNLSMGNLGMNSASTDKFNTAMSSTVGYQDVNAFTNAGALQENFNVGGATMTRNGGAVQNSDSLGQQYSQQASLLHAASKTLSDSFSHGESFAKGYASVRQKAEQSGLQGSAGVALNAANAAIVQTAVGHKVEITDGVIHDQNTAYKVVADGHGGYKIEAFGFSAGAGLDVNKSTGDGHKVDSGGSTGDSATNGQGTSSTSSSGLTASVLKTGSITVSASQAASSTWNESFQHNLASQETSLTQQSEAYSSAASAASTFSAQGPVDPGTFGQFMSDRQSVINSVGDQTRGVGGAVTAAQQALQGSAGAVPAAVMANAPAPGVTGQMGAHVPSPGATANIDAAGKAIVGAQPVTNQHKVKDAADKTSKQQQKRMADGKNAQHLIPGGNPGTQAIPTGVVAG